MTNIGVIGLGYWGSKVVEEYVALREKGEVNTVVACDLDESRLDRVEDVDNRYQDLTKALEFIDGLHICTPNASHAAIGKQALRAGVDVMIEKPLTTDRDSAFDLMEVASQEDGIIQTGHIFRFANVINSLRELYQDNRFGDLQEVTIRWTHDIEPPSETDVLWDLAPHPIDILNFVTNDWPSEETCRVRTIPKADGPVSATAQFRIATAEATMQVSWDDHVRRRYIEISGSKASAIVEAVDQTIEIYDAEGVHNHPVKTNNTIRAEATNFVNAIQTRRNTANSAVIGVRTVEAIERLQESAEDE